MPTPTASVSALLLAAALSACYGGGDSQRSPRDSGGVPHSAAARSGAPTPAPTPGPGPTAEPLILGAPLIRAEGFREAAAVSVGADGRYYVWLERGTDGAADDSVAAVDPTTGAVRARTTAGSVTAGRSAATVDRHGRTYTVDSATRKVAVAEPHDSARATPHPVLTGIDVPAALALDTIRGRLLVLEQRAGRLQVFELP